MQQQFKQQLHADLLGGAGWAGIAGNSASHFNATIPERRIQSVGGIVVNAACVCVCNPNNDIVPHVSSSSQAVRTIHYCYMQALTKEKKREGGRVMLLHCILLKASGALYFSDGSH